MRRRGARQRHHHRRGRGDGSCADRSGDGVGTRTETGLGRAGAHRPGRLAGGATRRGRRPVLVDLRNSRGARPLRPPSLGRKHLGGETRAPPTSHRLRESHLRGETGAGAQGVIPCITIRARAVRTHSTTPRQAPLPPTPKQVHRAQKCSHHEAHFSRPFPSAAPCTCRAPARPGSMPIRAHSPRARRTAVLRTTAEVHLTFFSTFL